MMARHARVGRLDWIGVRSDRRADVCAVDSAEVALGGLLDDHSRAGKRAVTLIQSEHLPVIEALAGRPVTFFDLRRNLVVSGLNLAALRKARVQIGQVVLEIEGPCPPCSRMEESNGIGGYNAVRGHGGWYASVVTPGLVAVGDAVTPDTRQTADHSS